MLKPQKLGTTVRQSFSKIEAATEMPNLIEVQKDSYKWFLEEGLNEVLLYLNKIWHFGSCFDFRKALSYGRAKLLGFKHK